MNKKFLAFLAVLILPIFLTGCLSGGGLLDQGNENIIQGQITNGDAGVQNVEVSIKSLNKNTTTDANGTYQFKDLKEDTYTLSFYKKDVIDPAVDKSATVAGGKTVTIDFKLNEQSTELEKAKSFVKNLNNTGIQMKQTINDEMKDINSNIQNNVYPKLENLNGKIGYATSFMYVWIGNHNFTYDNFSLLENGLLPPGEYEIDYENRIISQKTSYSLDQSPWSWKIDNTFQSNSKTHHELINITLTNPNKVYSIDTTTSPKTISIDLSNAEFNYNQKLEISSETVLETNSNLTLNSSQTETVSIETSSEIVKITYPLNEQLSLKGTMKDQWNPTINEKNYPELGRVSFDTLLNNDLYDDNKLSLEGSFSSNFLNIEGTMTTEFYNLPSNTFATGSDIDQLAKIKNINLNGNLYIPKSVEIDGDFSSGFIKNSQLPENININGSFTSYNSNGNWTTKLNGGLTINPVYDEYDPNYSMSSTNYITGEINFTGSYEENGAESFNLYIMTDIENYNNTDSQLRFEFLNGNYIDAGHSKQGGIFTTKDTINMEAYNQSNLKINLEANLNSDYTTSQKVGEIINTVDSKTYAQIYLNDGQINVKFNDKTTTSLFQ